MVTEFIKNNWCKTIRELREDEGTRLALPYPFTSPSEGDYFKDLFYWDTYFTNIGLLLSGREEQAKFNVDNMLYMVNKYGLMPNVCRTDSLNRSQPPFLCIMVRDLFDRFGDRAWLLDAYTILSKEYNYWMHNRMTHWGLNRYGGDISTCDKVGYTEYYLNRTGLKFKNINYDKIAADMLAEGESGWDYTPRFNNRGSEFVSIDLNCILYAFEENMAYFGKTLNDPMYKEWIAKAEKRKKLINEFLWNEEEGTYLDRNYLTGEWSKVLSAASFFALTYNVADKEQAEKMFSKLSLLEKPFGISCCEPKKYDAVYQWDYPNCWAPAQFAVVKGLKNYGFTESAHRIAEKYCKMIENCFLETGNLWEKYNAEDGTVNVVNEYEMPTMLGWTAGVYLYCLNIDNQWF